MIHIIPITETKVDWNIYLQAARQVLGRSTTSKLDSIKKEVGDLGSYISSLIEFESEDSNIHIRNAGALLRHIQVGFFVLCEKDFQLELLQRTRLSMVCQERCAIVSGNLEEWYVAIINGATDSASINMRIFVDKCIIYFESIGLGGLWSDYQKIKLPDQTFKLLQK